MVLPVKISLLGVLGLVLLGLEACAEIPQEPPVVEQSIDSQLQACSLLVRRMRSVCNSGLREGNSRKNTARTNFDCMSARLEFQRECAL